MDKITKPIGKENAQRVAERFILDKYPYATVVFESTELKTDGTRQVYEVTGQCRLNKWPKSVGRKSRYDIQIDAYNADIIRFMERNMCYVVT